MDNDSYEAINEVVRSTPNALPIYIYYVELTEERFISHVPLAVGDYLSVTLTSGEKVKNKRITKIHHLEQTVNVGKSVVSAFLSVQD